MFNQYLLLIKKHKWSSFASSFNTLNGIKVMVLNGIKCLEFLDEVYDYSFKSYILSSINVILIGKYFYRTVRCGKRHIILAFHVVVVS